MTSRDNNTVLITGASKGIGLASARLLAQRGFNIVGLARSVLETEFPGDFFDKVLVKQVFLDTVDRKWVDHLHQMDVFSFYACFSWHQN